MDNLSLCLIARDENEYISEWLDYHIFIGVNVFMFMITRVELAAE
jgi:hypothetical protein